jgi:hypothetical protein
MPESTIMEAPIAKAIVTEAMSAEPISTEAACPKAQTGVPTAESLAATHVASKSPSARESAMPASTHLRHGRHRRSEEQECRNGRNGKKAAHNYTFSPIPG